MICHALWGQVFPQQDMAIFMLSVYYLLSKESLRLLPQWRSNLAVSASMLVFDLARILCKLAKKGVGLDSQKCRYVGEMN